MNPYVERILGLVGDRPVIQSLEHTAKRIEAVAGSLGPARLERSYAPGKWTARQILAHLADCELGIGFRLRQALAEENHRAQPFDQDRWAARGQGGVEAGVARGPAVLVEGLGPVILLGQDRWAARY